MGGYKKTLKALEYLLGKEGQPFQIEELCSYCGWTRGTGITYYRKKWRHFISELSNGTFRVHDPSYLVENTFRQIHTQNLDEKTISGLRVIPYDYDVALSFAGENRAYVKRVAEYLFQFGIQIFYDEFEESKLWGKDLYTHLDEIYRRKSRYCMVFLSEHYARKAWPKHERKSAQARDLFSEAEYILPIKLDSSNIPGIRETVGFLDGTRKDPEEVGYLFLEKIGKNNVLDEILGILREWYSDYEITVKGQSISFKSNEHHVDSTYPIKLFVSLHELGYLAYMFCETEVLPR